VIELVLQAAIEIGLAGPCPIDPLGKDIGAGFDLPGEIHDRLAAMVEDLDKGTDADGEKKCDDQRRNRAP
jgi:hypothetical protein